MILLTFQNVLFYYQDIKTGAKEGIALYHDMNKNEHIKHLHLGNNANSTNSVQNMSIFHYHENIISKLMTVFVTELVEIVHYFHIVTNFSVKDMRSRSFSLQIHLSS